MKTLTLAAALLLLAGCGVSSYPFKKHHDDPPQKQKTTDDGPAVERVPG